MHRLRPPGILVWSQTRATGSLAPLDQLPVTRPPALVVLGGLVFNIGNIAAFGLEPGQQRAQQCDGCVGQLRQLRAERVHL